MNLQKLSTNQQTAIGIVAILVIILCVFLLVTSSNGNNPVKNNRTTNSTSQLPPTADQPMEQWLADAAARHASLPDVGAGKNQYTYLERDLNGDGKADKIRYSLYLTTEEGFPQLRGQLTVNDQSATTPGTSPDDYFGIVDLVTADKLKQVAITDMGPSSDYTTTFYSYDGKNLVSYQTIEGPYSSMKFDGKGKVTTLARANVLDTWFHEDDYVLSGRNFVHKPREFYERTQSTKVTALLPLTFQRTPKDPATAFTLRKGESATILGCDDVAWCKIKNTQGIEGWFEVIDGFSITKDEIPSGEAFAGLSFAD